jgi:hypothetical protein
MPSGAWIVSEWLLRMPILARAPTAGGEIKVMQFLENGGRIYSQDEATRKDSIR